MGRSKQGAIVRRGRRLYARIRWTENVDGQSIHRERLARVRNGFRLAPPGSTGRGNSRAYGFSFLFGARRFWRFLIQRGTI